MRGSTRVSEGSTRGVPLLYDQSHYSSLTGEGLAVMLYKLLLLYPFYNSSFLEEFKRLVMERQGSELSTPRSVTQSSACSTPRTTGSIMPRTTGSITPQTTGSRTPTPDTMRGNNLTLLGRNVYVCVYKKYLFLGKLQLIHILDCFWRNMLTTVVIVILPAL